MLLLQPLVVVPAGPAVASWAEFVEQEGVGAPLLAKHLSDDEKWTTAVTEALAPGLLLHLFVCVCVCDMLTVLRVALPFVLLRLWIG